MEQDGPQSAGELEQRARKILGLEDLERLPQAVPVRVEQFWRADSFAPVVPYAGSLLLPLGKNPGLGVIEASIAGAVRRHDALRTRLAIEKDRAILAPAAPAPKLQCQSILRADITAQQEGRHGALTEFFKTPIQLLEGPSFHARAFLDEDQNVTLGILMHHYFGDAWSSQILRREIENGIRQGAQALPVPAQYSEFALFQRRALDKNLSRTLDFWRRRFAGAPATRLPFDAQDDSGKRARAFFLIEDAVMRKLMAFSKEERVSLGLLSFAAFHIALARWCGEKSIVAAVVAANRIRHQFRDTIGYLIGAIGVYSKLTPDTAFRDFALGVARDVYDAVGHQDLAVDHYNEIFCPPQPFCTPRFNFIGRQENFFIGDTGSATPAVIGVQPGPDMRKIAGYTDLHVLLMEYPEGLLGRITHSKRLSLEKITAFVEIYRAVLSRIADDRNLKLGVFL